MTRSELGSRMQQWHASMHDPIYAVGSFYSAGKAYPKVEVVVDALDNLSYDLDKHKRMLAGEKIATIRTDDLRKFARYSDNELQNDINDLEEIVSELKRFMREDYNA